ncbi:MAG: helix-turn-helix domain-containing protein [Rhodoferax sp.]
MERLLTPQNLAEVTGLAVQTIYNRHSNGDSLPKCLMLGRLLRFRQSDVDAWLDSQYERLGFETASGNSFEPRTRRTGRPTKAEQVARRRAKTCN